MNWAPLTFDWNQVRAFLATAEEGSLSAAARALGQSQPTLGRQVSALEERLGVVLFERVGRSLALTPTGHDLLDHARAMTDAAGRLSLAASGARQTVEGSVSISASDIIAAYHIPPLLSALRAQAPGLEIRIIAANEISDLQRREADIALRHLRPTEPDLIARLLGEATAHFYAAPAYLDRYGPVANVADLDQHSVVTFGDPDGLVDALAKRGYPVPRNAMRLHSDDGVAAWQMAVQGLGLCIMGDATAALWPDMRRVLPELGPITFPIWLVAHRELLTSRRIRIVYDYLADAVRANWNLDKE